MAYNVKIETYPDGVKIYRYKKPIISKKQSCETEYQENNIENEHSELEKDYNLDNDDVLMSSLNRTKNMIYKLARSNDFDYFVTITFNPNEVNRTDYNEISKKFSKYLNNYQNRHEKLNYIFVPELHKDKKSYHFHGLVSGLSKKYLSSAYNPNNGKPITDKKGRSIYNWSKFNLGYTTVTPITNGYHPVSWYLSKYITKEVMLKSKNRKRYWRSSELKEPEIMKLMLDTENLIENVIESYKKMYKKNDSLKTIKIENGTYQNQIDIFDFY